MADHIKHQGPSECIKIYKLMKANKATTSFQDAISFYLRNCKASEKTINDYIETVEDEQAEVFQAAVERLEKL